MHAESFGLNSFYQFLLLFLLKRSRNLGRKFAWRVNSSLIPKQTNFVFISFVEGVFANQVMPVEKILRKNP